MKLAALLLVLGACAIDDVDSGLSPNDGFDDTVDDGKADASGARAVHRFADRRLFPEGGAFDPVERAFYVGSLEHGSITRIDEGGTESVFHPGSGEAGRLTLGMQVDAAARLLWVCTTLDSLGRIWIFDLATGERTADIDLAPANREAACNDVLLEGNGSALVSDRENPFIYRVTTAGAVAVWATDPLLKGGLVSLNSMAFTPDRKAVITAPYLPPALIRVDVASRKVTKVALTGDLFMDGFNVLNGPDDLVMHDGQLVVAFGSSLKRIVPSDASWTRATVRSTRTIGGVTALVEDGDRLYGINGQSVRFALEIPPTPFQIFEVDIAALR
jgi:hypothetical protein